MTPTTRERARGRILPWTPQPLDTFGRDLAAELDRAVGKARVAGHEPQIRALGQLIGLSRTTQLPQH